MKKFLIFALVISSVLLLFDIIGVISVSISLSDGIAFVKNIFYVVAGIIAIICITSIIIASISIKRM